VALFDGFAIPMFHRLVFVLCLGAKRVTRGRWEGFEDFGLADRVSLSLLTIGVLPGCRAHVANSPKKSIPRGLVRKPEHQSDRGEI
jgi:hypothetical protein